MSQEILEAILFEAREGNAENDITGMLMYADGIFVQVLEGEQFIVRRLVAKIEQDTRHNGLDILLQEPIDEPSFSNWEMAYLPLDPRDAPITGIPGVETLSELTERMREKESYVGMFLKRSAERLFQAVA